MRSKTQIKIPKGWRPLKIGEQIRKGDKYYIVGDDWHDWLETTCDGYIYAGKNCYIRKKPFTKKPKRIVKKINQNIPCVVFVICIKG